MKTRRALVQDKIDFVKKWNPEFANKLGYEYTTEDMVQPGVLGIVYEDEGKTGYIFYQHVNTLKKIIWITDVFVDKESRNSGFGTKMMKRFIDSHRGSMFILDSFIESKSFYERLGFRITGYEMTKEKE